MVLSEMDVNTEAGRGSERPGNNCSVGAERTNRGFASRLNNKHFTELVPIAISVVAAFAYRSRQSKEVTTTRLQRPPACLSSAGEQRRDAAKIVAAKREPAAAAADESGCWPLQMNIARTSLPRYGAAVEANSRRAARATSSEHLSAPLTRGEQRNARVESNWMRRDLSAKKRSHKLPLHHFPGRAETGRVSMQRARGNSAVQSSRLQWNALYNARNVPASEERRRHRAKLARAETAIPIRELRHREVRASSRMNIRAQVHRRSAEARLQGHPRACGGRFPVKQVRPLPLDSVRARLQALGGLRGSSARGALRFRTRSIPRRSREILCGDWICD